MYRGPSPIFDVPEFPPLRRVKPLPKRRRTSADPSSPTHDASSYAQAQGMMPSDGPVDMSAFGLNMPLPQYYMPIFNGVQDLFRMGAEDRPLEYPGGFAVPVGAADEEDHGDGDYVDHLQQPGNTKKRKVPTAHHSGNDHLSSPITLGEDDPDERGHSMVPTGRNDAGEGQTSDSTPSAFAATASLAPTKKNRSSAATIAGLQHKELLRTRKRQLAAALGALSHGDTLALDQALSARYSTMASLSAQSKTEGKENDPEGKPRRRLARRKIPNRELLPAPELSTIVALPMGDFTFACPCPTSERLVSTREEVAVLHSRFETELSRQAAKAAEIAKQNALASESGPVAKRGDRTQQRSRTSGAVTGTSPNNNGFLDAPGTGAKSRTSKKKKRSALANASNPHHLRNYVPSRIPHSGQVPPAQGTAKVQNLVSPPPLRFLSAEIVPSRRKKSAPAPAPSIAALNQPEEEWICAFCEYNLFYGEDAAFRRAVRSRKKILGRRRRARERAAAAASGQKASAAPVDKSTTATESFDSHVDDEYAGAVVGNTPVKQGGPVNKRERDKQAL